MTTHSCPEALCLASQSLAPILMFQAAHTWLWSSYLCMWNSKKPRPKEILDHETNLWFGLSSSQSNLSKLVKIQLACIFRSTEATRKYYWLCHVLFSAVITLKCPFIIKGKCVTTIKLNPTFAEILKTKTRDVQEIPCALSSQEPSVSVCACSSQSLGTQLEACMENVMPSLWTCLFPLPQYLKDTEEQKARMIQGTPLWILITLKRSVYLVVLLWRTFYPPSTHSLNGYYSQFKKLHGKSTIWCLIFSPHPSLPTP